jgi:hypothetical protein
MIERTKKRSQFPRRPSTIRRAELAASRRVLMIRMVRYLSIRWSVMWRGFCDRAFASAVSTLADADGAPAGASAADELADPATAARAAVELAKAAAGRNESRLRN